MDQKRIEEIISAFKGKRVAVIGDIMLDKYIFGHVSRISPEYPVPVVDVSHEDHRLGGAANVALNTLSLGAETLLFGITGNDANRATMLELFKTHGLSSHSLISDSSRPTTCKTRILSQNHHITRVGFCKKGNDIDDSTMQQVLDALMEIIGTIDAIVLEDYNKGTC